MCCFLRRRRLPRSHRIDTLVPISTHVRSNLLDADATEGEAMLQRLVDRIEPITVFERTFCLNISSGVCQAGYGASTLEQLIHDADQALYRAKHEGSDRVVRADRKRVEQGKSVSVRVALGGRRVIIKK